MLALNLCLVFVVFFKIFIPIQKKSMLVRVLSIFKVFLLENGLFISIQPLLQGLFYIDSLVKTVKIPGVAIIGACFPPCLVLVENSVGYNTNNAEEFDKASNPNRHLPVSCNI